MSPAVWQLVPSSAAVSTVALMLQAFVTGTVGCLPPSWDEPLCWVVVHIPLPALHASVHMPTFHRALASHCSETGVSTKSRRVGWKQSLPLGRVWVTMW